jgi:hypothetical protein
MSPAEKAKELFDKMNGFRISYAHRVKCAKIVVDEILSVLFQHHEIDYWKEVKTELDKLAVKK